MFKTRSEVLWVWRVWGAFLLASGFATIPGVGKFRRPKRSLKKKKKKKKKKHRRPGSLQLESLAPPVDIF